MGSMSLPALTHDAHQAPRAPSLLRGVTSPEATSWVASVSVTPPSLLVRAHVPIPNPPLGLASALPRGLCRLLSAPAGSGTFPALSLQSLCRCSDPYPVTPCWCARPLLPSRHRTHPSGNEFVAPYCPCGSFSKEPVFRGCSHSLMFGLPHSLGPQAAPTAESQGTPGGRALYTTQNSVGYLPRAVASLRTRLRAIGTAGLSLRISVHRDHLDRSS